MNYEIEIRFVVDTPDEAFQLLPFLEASLGSPKRWKTDIIGEQIFRDGRLLRIGQVYDEENVCSFLGYKGPDVGRFANIRQEWGEEITGGIVNSTILRKMKIDDDFSSAEAVTSALSRAGHRSFMSFSGEDSLGFYEPLSIHTKLCRCQDIVGERTLIELELSANSPSDAESAEIRLMEIARQYNLTKMLLRDEPPTLLYRACQQS